MQLMIRIVLVLTLSISAIASDAPDSAFLSPSFNFGKVLRGTAVEHEYVLRNEGSQSLQIIKVSLTPPLLVTRMPSQIAPGASAIIRAKLDTSRLKGPFEGIIVVYLGDSQERQEELQFEGEIVPPIEVSPLPAFFVTSQRGTAKQASLDIIGHEDAPLDIKSMEAPKGRFLTKLDTVEEGRRYRLTLMLDANGPGGRNSDLIVLHTSSKSTPELKIPVNTYLRERVYTFPESVDLGWLRLADIKRDPTLLARAAQTLMVYQVGGNAFAIKTKSEEPTLNVKWERGPAGDRYQITIALLAGELQAGAIKSTIVIETNDEEFPQIVVPVTGNIVP